MEKVKRVKIKKFSRSLTEESLNYKVFFALIKSVKQAGRGLIKIAEGIGYLLDEYDMTSVYQKFHGTYYANKESQRMRKKIRQEWEIKKAIKDLQKMNYIKVSKNGKRVYLIEKGALEFLKFNLLTRKPDWDRKWRVVIFDILEKKRGQRNFLRKQLKWLGFRELQKSVWVFPYDIKKELEELLTICDFDAQGDIRFLTVEKIEDDRDLKREFGLI